MSSRRATWAGEFAKQRRGASVRSKRKGSNGQEGPRARSDGRRFLGDVYTAGGAPFFQELILVMLKDFKMQEKFYFILIFLHLKHRPRFGMLQTSWRSGLCALSQS